MPRDDVVDVHASMPRSRLERFFDPTPEETSRWPHVVVICLFGIVGVTVSVAAIDGMADQYSSASWPSTTGSVVQCRIVNNELEFIASFRAKGAGHRLSRRRLVAMSLEDLTFDRNAFVRRHPPGSAIQVWHHPTRPSRATVSPGLTWLDVAALVVLLRCVGVVIARAASFLVARGR